MMTLDWDKIITAAIPVLLGGATGGGLIRYNARLRIRVIQERTQLIGRQVFKLQDLFTKLEVRFTQEEAARAELCRRLDDLKEEVRRAYELAREGHAELSKGYLQFGTAVATLKNFADEWKSKASAVHDLPEGKVRIEDPKRGKP